MVKKVDNYFKPAKFYSMHGLTEALRSTYLEPSQIHIRPTSIGKAIPEVEVFVLSEDGYECKANEVGELIHRGCCIYKEYWNSPQETAKRFKSISILKKIIDIDNPDEIVVATGDLVYRDSEGYLYLKGRQDDMIKTGGYRVSPKEIEEVVYNNIPNITKCAVFGIPNPDIEEEIVLIYSAKSKIPKNELIFELKKHLATYMIPTIIEYRDSLPLKASHHEEVDKGVLKKEFLNR
jgi:acyl-CoA synthetase (AMP-forming)/AMP-acid ligase II